MDKLTPPKQSLGDLTTVFQQLQYLHATHPDDTNLFICLCEAERQMKIAWHIHDEQKRAML